MDDVDQEEELESFDGRMYYSNNQRRNAEYAAKFTRNGPPFVMTAQYDLGGPTPRLVLPRFEAKRGLPLTSTLPSDDDEDDKGVTGSAVEESSDLDDDFPLLLVDLEEGNPSAALKALRTHWPLNAAAKHLTAVKDEYTKLLSTSQTKQENVDPDAKSQDAIIK